MTINAPDRMYELVNLGVSLIVVHLAGNVLQKLHLINPGPIGLEIGNITIDIGFDTHR